MVILRTLNYQNTQISKVLNYPQGYFYLRYIAESLEQTIYLDERQLLARYWSAQNIYLKLHSFHIYRAATFKNICTKTHHNFITRRAGILHKISLIFTTTCPGTYCSLQLTLLVAQIDGFLGIALAQGASSWIIDANSRTLASAEYHDVHIHVDFLSVTNWVPKTAEPLPWTQ